MDPLTPESEFVRSRTLELTLEDGLRLGVRPIVPGDRDQIAAGIGQISEESVLRRFFRPLTRFTETELDYLTQIDYDNHFAWVAYLAPNGEGVGVARYVRVDGAPGVAEAAILVVDEYQGRGIGKILLQLLAESAQANGIERFRGYALPENRPVLDAAASRGIDVHREDGMAVVDVALPIPTGLEDSDVYALLKMTAAGEITFGR